MSIEFAKAYKNFQSFDMERTKRKEGDRKTERSPSTGLLAPRTNRSTEQPKNATELDKVSDYVQQIRKHRMKLKNGE